MRSASVPRRVKTEDNKIAAGSPAAHICGHDGIGRHARFRFSCSDALGFESPCPHHVGASCISLAPTFYKSQSALIPLLLLSDRDSLRWIRGRFLTGDEIKISENVLFFARNLDIRRLPSFDRGKVDFPKSSDRTRDIFIPGRHMNMTFRYNVSCNALQML